MGAEQALSGACMATASRRPADMPDATAIEHRRRAADEEAIEVVAADGGIARSRTAATGSARRIATGSGRRCAFSPSRSLSPVHSRTRSKCAPVRARARRRPCARRRGASALSPVSRTSASSIACCTERPFVCRCQPTKGEPSYSIVSL